MFKEFAIFGRIVHIHKSNDKNNKNIFLIKA